MDYIIIMALCEKLRHWRYLAEKDPGAAGIYWKYQIMQDTFFLAWQFLCPWDVSWNTYRREFRELAESILETDINKFNRSFFASEYVIED